MRDGSVTEADINLTSVSYDTRQQLKSEQQVLHTTMSVQAERGWRNAETLAETLTQSTLHTIAH